jgi:hypothetical protein
MRSIIFFLSLCFIQHKEAVVLDHAISSLLQASAQDSSELAQLYEDKDGFETFQSISKIQIFSFLFSTLFFLQIAQGRGCIHHHTDRVHKLLQSLARHS